MPRFGREKLELQYAAGARSARDARARRRSCVFHVTGGRPEGRPSMWYFRRLHVGR